MATDPPQTSLDVLENEDLLISGLFRQIRETCDLLETADGDPKILVQQSYQYGRLGRTILRHLAIRQAAAIDVSAAISTLPDLRPTAEHLVERATACRALIDDLRHMSLNVQPLYLNAQQDFDTPLVALITMASATIDWELSEAIPHLHQHLQPDTTKAPFRTSRYVSRHAPRKLNTSGPRWYEGAPVISRFITLCQRIREIQI